MRPPLEGTILVTGASSGIGEALALQLAPKAGALILVARRASRMEELRRQILQLRPGLAVHVMPTDLTDLAAIDGLVERIHAEVGPVDVLINNAGLGDIALFDQTDWGKLHTMLQLNVVSLTQLTHRLVPDMLAQGRGGILNLSSGFGLTFMPAVAAYAGTKHYVSAFSEGLRLDLKSRGIVVTQVCPGPVATEFESKAGNPTGQQVPGFVEISAEQCAREALRGFEANRALVVPGFAARLLILLGRISPRWALRLTYSPIAPWLRSRASHS